MNKTYRRFQDRVVIILGNSCKMESGVAEMFRAEQGTVYVFDISGTDSENLRRQIHEVYQKHGRIDILVTVPLKENRDDDIEKMDIAVWRRCVFEQFERIAVGAEECIAAMKKTGGVLLAVCSGIAADTGIDRDLGASILHTALRQYLRCATTRLAGYRIRSEIVFYSGIDDFPDIGANSPLGRIGVHSSYLPRQGTITDVTEAVAFLASDDGTLMTGSELYVDGAIGVGTNRYEGHFTLAQLLFDQEKHTGAGRFEGSVSSEAKNRKPGESKPTAFSMDMIGTPLNMPQQTIVLTGVSKGLGRALAERLIDEGHTVIGCARSSEAMAQLNRRYGKPHRFDAIDLTDKNQVVRWAKELESEGSVPDFLINNAALAGNTSLQIWKQDENEFKEILLGNIMPTFNTIHAFVPMMLRRMKGIVVNFSSEWARRPSSKVGPDATSKWGIEGLSRVLAKELPSKMCCVSLNPGIVQTETMARTYGRFTDNYPTTAEWLEVAVPFILSVTPTDNGKALTVTGMDVFKGI